jgi:hypothetical protein
MMRSLLLVAACLAVPATLQAQGSKDPEKRKQTAKERCQAQRGVDCHTAEGLKQWELEERSRAEAVRDGSRRRPRNAPAN